MGVLNNEVLSTGLTVLYQPDSGKPNVDIVFVHGLQGHPQNTWSAKAEVDQQSTVLSHESSKSPTSSLLSPPSSYKKRTTLRHFLSSSHLFPKSGAKTVQGGNVKPRTSNMVFWPRDLLPTDCPKARIITWGYDTVVTKGYKRSTSKNNIFAHARDLLYSLDRERSQHTPLIFVAHSLGGVLVKEVLRRAETSVEIHLNNIVQSTRAVVFLGTPHRGSADMAALGDVVRKVASTVLRVDSNASILRALGVDSPELELCRESFITQWRLYNFTVKTFQESTGLTGFNIGLANEKVVPDTSSCLDDPREHSETIPANHMNMCRYTSRSDPGYVKVGKELKALATPKGGLSEEAADCLTALSFTEQESRYNTIRPAVERTCDWLSNSAKYNSWLESKDYADNHGLLWLKGKPGSGKSTLMKEMFRRARQSKLETSSVAAFFFNARGDTLAKSPCGFFRSILHQLIKQDIALMAQFLPLFVDKRAIQREHISWQEEEFHDFFRKAFTMTSTARKVKPTFIFIDALDECEEKQARAIVYYFRRLTDDAFAVGSEISVCFASRHYPTITIDRCPEIAVEHENRQDITQFVSTKMQLIPQYEAEEIAQLQNQLAEKSDGIFLWAVLVTDLVLKDLDDGKPASDVQETIRNVPEELGALFASIFSNVTFNERQTSVILVQWTLLSQKTLSGPELYHAVSFSNSQKLDLERFSDAMQDMSTNKIKKFIRSYSKGLIEIRQNMVQFIHESVRQFFLSEVGLGQLNLALDSNVLGDGHCTIIQACVNSIAVAHLLSQTGRRGQYHALAILDIDVNWMVRYASLNLIMHAERAKQCGAPHPMLQVVREICWRLTATPNFEVSPHLRHLCSVCLFWCVASMEKIKELFAAKQFLLQDQLATIISRLDSSVATSSNSFHYTPTNSNKWDDGTNSLGLHKQSLRGIDLHKTEVGLDTLLHRAVETNKAELVSLLLSNGAVADARNDRGRTPLHQAALYSDAEIVQMLIDHDANVSAKDEEGNLALHLAVERQDSPSSKPSKAQIAKALIHAGTPVNSQNIYGKTPLHSAGELSSPEIFVILQDAGGDLAVPDCDNESPLEAVRLRLPGNPSSEGGDIRNPRGDIIWRSINPRALFTGASTNPDKMMASRNSARMQSLAQSTDNLDLPDATQETPCHKPDSF